MHFVPFNFICTEILRVVCRNIVTNLWLKSTISFVYLRNRFVFFCYVHKINGSLLSVPIHINNFDAFRKTDFQKKKPRARCFSEVFQTNLKFLNRWITWISFAIICVKTIHRNKVLYNWNSFVFFQSNEFSMPVAEDAISMLNILRWNQWFAFECNSNWF